MLTVLVFSAANLIKNCEGKIFQQPRISEVYKQGNK